MGLGGGGGEGILAVAVVPMEAIPMAEPQILAGGKTVGLRADLLDCHNCRLPLKPPIFKVRSAGRPSSPRFIFPLSCIWHGVTERIWCA